MLTDCHIGDEHCTLWTNPIAGSQNPVRSLDLSRCALSDAGLSALAVGKWAAFLVSFLCVGMRGCREFLFLQLSSFG